MLVVSYTIGLVAWVTWIWVQHHYGDRPTTSVWLALMLALGIFEYTKSMLALIHGAPAVLYAASAALLAAGAIAVMQAHRAWEKGSALEPESALSRGA